jgi:hypothetical protein
MFSDLITSKSRVKLLNVFLTTPSNDIHVRDLVRKTGDEINAVRENYLFREKRNSNKRTSRKQSLLFS